MSFRGSHRDTTAAGWRIKVTPFCSLPPAPSCGAGRLPQTRESQAWMSLGDSVGKAQPCRAVCPTLWTQGRVGVCRPAWVLARVHSEEHNKVHLLEVVCVSVQGVHVSVRWVVCSWEAAMLSPAWHSAESPAASLLQRRSQSLASLNTLYPALCERKCTLST